MFRLSHYMQQLVTPTPPRRRTGPVRPVVIWNLTRRCNLKCRHCYAVAADHHFPGELTSSEAVAVLDDLAAFRSDRPTYTDFARPLRHGGKHNVHDADAADKQADTGNGTQDDVKGPLGSFRLLKECKGNTDDVIFLFMESFQHPLDGNRCRFHAIRAVDLDDDLV